MEVDGRIMEGGGQLCSSLLYILIIYLLNVLEDREILQYSVVGETHPTSYLTRNC